MEQEHAITPKTFSFGGHTLTCLVRRSLEDGSKEFLTFQMTVEEIFDSFWNWGAETHKQQQQHNALPPKQPSNVAAPAPVEDGSQPELLGLDVWPAAVRLCEYLSVNPTLVAGLDVAELGAGMGLPGLLCIKLGARHVLSTDYVEEVVEHIRRNGELNGAGPPAFTAGRLDWTDLSELQPQQLHSFRVLLMADVLYQSQLVEPLVAAMLSLLHPQGVILLGHLPRRAIVPDPEYGIPTLVDNDEPYHLFRSAVGRAGLHCHVLSDGKEEVEVEEEKGEAAEPAATAGGSAGGSRESKQRPMLLAFALDPEQLQHLPAVGALRS